MMKTKRVLIKLGGAALDTDLTVVAVGQAIRHYRQLGFEVVLVHGGGPAINHELRKRGIQWTFLNGQRITTPEMIEVIELTLCGIVNRRLVRQLGAADLPVIGVSGTDRQMLLCRAATPELGMVGAIQQVNSDWLIELMNLQHRPVPLVAPIGVGAQGECYNINADWAATHLATALKVDQLLFLTDQEGVLDEEGICIEELSASGLQNMIDFKVVSGGMLTKAQAVLHALKNSVPSVRILKATEAAAAVTDKSLGTSCVSQSSQVIPFVLPMEKGVQDDVLATV